MESSLMLMLVDPTAHVVDEGLVGGKRHDDLVVLEADEELRRLGPGRVARRPVGLAPARRLGAEGWQDLVLEAGPMHRVSHDVAATGASR
jgi:hypothetical protein